MGFRGDGVCLAFHLTSSVLAQFLLSSCLHGLSLVFCLPVDPIAALFSDSSSQSQSSSHPEGPGCIICNVNQPLGADNYPDN